MAYNAIFMAVWVTLSCTALGDSGDLMKQSVPAELDSTWEPHPKAFIELPAGVGYLRKMIQAVMQIEQNLVAPYLSAAYSLHEGTNTNASKLLHGIGIEEMLHMAVMANILNAVGGHPQVVEDNPASALRYPKTLPFVNVTIDVAPFSPKQVDVFAQVEKPDWKNPFAHTVGLAFLRLVTLTEVLVLWHGEAAVFSGDPSLQVTFTTAKGARIAPVKSSEDAKYYFLWVGMQGEGGHGNFFDQNPFLCPPFRLEHPHYYRFLEVRKGRYYKVTDMLGHSEDPTGEPLDTDWDAVHDFGPNPKAEDYKTTHPDIYEKMIQFKLCYSSLLEHLHLAFNGAPDTFMSTIRTMYELTAMAKELIATPAPGQPGKNVGPPWEWVNATEVNASCKLLFPSIV